jgi:hypothetical protein
VDTQTAYRRSAETMRDGYQASREMVQEYPLSSAMTVFGLGFGLGVAIGILLSEGESHPSYEGRMERFGRQMLDAMAQMAPEAISRRLS